MEITIEELLELLSRTVEGLTEDEKRRLRESLLTWTFTEDDVNFLRGCGIKC